MILTLQTERQMERIAAMMKTVAATGVYKGLLNTPDERLYFERCKAGHRQTGTILIFTRDTGHHTGGWFKNPDYERCLHLSLSFVDPVTEYRIDQNKPLAKMWCQHFFGQHRDLIWVEPPYSDKGKALMVWHYRLFCNPAWEPIHPRGEVYSREFTEKGWKSFSDIHGFRAKDYEMTWGNVLGEKT